MLLIRILSQGLTFLILIILAQSLGPEIYGQWAFIFGYLVFFTLLISFGINEIIVREISARPEERDGYLRAGMLLKGLFSLIAIILAVGILFALRIPGEVRMWGAIASLTLLTSFAFHSYRTILEVPFQADFRMEGPSFILLISRAIFLALLLLWMKKGITLGVAIVAQVGSEGIGMLLFVYLALRFGYPLKPKWDLPRFRHILSQSWPIAVSGAFVMIYTKADVLLLQALRGSQEVGFFAVSKRLVDALAIIPTVFMAAALPLFSHFFQHNVDQFQRWIKVSFRLLLALILPVCALTVFYAADIIRLFYGSEYAPSASALAILIWAEVFVYGGLIFDGALVASGRQRYGTLLAAGMAIFNLLINVWGIPRYGFVAAAWASAISYSLGLVLSVLIPPIRNIGTAFWRELFVPLCIAVGLAFCARWLNFSLGLAIAWEVAAFYAGLILTGELKLKDLERLRDLMFTRAE